MTSRPLARRDMTLRSPREIAAHLAFALYLVLLPLGGVAIGVGLTRHSPAAGWIGGVALVLFAALHLFGRRALGFATILHQLKRNPFKPMRQESSGPSDSGTRQSRREPGSCGLL